MSDAQMQLWANAEEGVDADDDLVDWEALRADIDQWVEETPAE